MKYLNRIILILFVFACVMPAFADTANDRVSQWKKDRLAEARDSQPTGTTNSDGGSATNDGATWSRAEEGSRFTRDGHAKVNDRFPWAAPGLVPNDPNGTQSQQSDGPGDNADAEGWFWDWFGGLENAGSDDGGLENEHEDDHEAEDEDDFGDDEADAEEDDASPVGP